MRTEQEILKLILDVAKQDDRIRGVAMNGSRTNPNAHKDIFQDYDIVYMVTDIDYFIGHKNWIRDFGEQIIMQTPEDMTLFPPELGGRFPYLMQFSDGNRIDLTLVPVEEAHTYVNEDKLTVILMDKDNKIPKVAPPTDEDYWVKPPLEEFFNDCCNEFWWISTYISKGLWRQEIIYAKKHLDENLRPMLIKMLEWQVGIQMNFSLSLGKYGEYLERHLAKEDWNQLICTYADGSYENTWRALFVACDLFQGTGAVVAEYFGYKYPYEDGRRVMEYLRHVKNLPLDAKEIY